MTICLKPCYIPPSVKSRNNIKATLKYVAITFSSFIDYVTNHFRLKKKCNQFLQQFTFYNI